VLDMLSRGLKGDYPYSTRYPNSYRIRYIVVKVDGGSYDENWFIWKPFITEIGELALLLRRW